MSDSQNTEIESALPEVKLINGTRFEISFQDHPGITISMPRIGMRKLVTQLRNICDRQLAYDIGLDTH